jgi:EpsI family protein
VTIDGVPLFVNRVQIRKGDITQLVYYWFQEQGRVITNEYLVKWYLFWDALTRRRTDGALVRLTILVPPGENIAEADEKLTSFIKEVSGHLGEFIPR